MAEANHSRLDDLGAAGIDSAGLALEVGDTLSLTYAACTDTQQAPATWDALVRRSSSGPPTPLGLRPHAGTWIPTRFALYQNRTNPFRGTTLIVFDLPVVTPVRLEVFELLGRPVATLADREYPAGAQTIEWNLRDVNGSRVRPGVHIYRLIAGTFREKTKMSVLP